MGPKIQEERYYKSVSGSELMKILFYFFGFCEMYGMFQIFKFVIYRDLFSHAK